MDYRIRQAALSDINHIMHIEQASFAPAIRETQSIFEERLTVAPECSRVLYSTANGRIFGYFTAEIWEKSSLSEETFLLGHSTAACHVPNGNVLYISSFALLPELRGRKIETADGSMGIAKMFFRSALEEILAAHPNIQKMLLLVHEDWKNAQRIYQSENFACLTAFPEFHGFEGKTALIYEKKREGVTN